MTDMPASAAGESSGGAFELVSERVGCLPVVSHFIDRIDLDGRLERFVATRDRRVRLAYGRVVGVLVRNIVVRHRPLYAIGEWAERYVPGLLGLAPGTLPTSMMTGWAGPLTASSMLTGRAC